MKNDTLIYIVSHNHEKYLEQCLDSVFLQIDSKTDVILIDSGSKDSSPKILKKYSKKYGASFFSKKMILPNIIDWVYDIYLNKYKYIMRVDGDDALRSGALSCLKENISKDSNIGSVSGSWIEIDESSNSLNKMILEDGYAIEAFHGACTLFRTKALKNIFFKSNDIKAQDGLYTWLNIKTNWKCITISNLIFQYRRHRNNISNNEENLFLNRKLAYMKVFNSKNIKIKCCAVIGYMEEDIKNYEINTNSNFYSNLEIQLEYLEKSSTIEKIYISCKSDISNKIDLNKYKKVNYVERTSNNTTLISSIQNCKNLEEIIQSYTDILILNPVKNVWTDCIIDIGVYSKYIHSYNTVIACKLIKGTVFTSKNQTLEMVNFSNFNTALASNFLYIRLSGFILLSHNHLYSFKDKMPEPIGQVSDNFLHMGWESI